MGCIGNTELKNIQIEKGNTPTAFVEPKITQMETSGILNDLRSLNLMLTDVNVICGDGSKQTIKEC